jgi:hypothetical protein
VDATTSKKGAHILRVINPLEMSARPVAYQSAGAMQQLQSGYGSMQGQPQPQGPAGGKFYNTIRVRPRPTHPSIGSPRGTDHGPLAANARPWPQTDVNPP